MAALVRAKCRLEHAWPGLGTLVSGDSVVLQGVV
jgi:hypothetical protein